MTSFDNRTLIDRFGFAHGQRLIDHARGLGAPHMICRVGDVMLGYCYIRKNACSSFKRLFLDMAHEEYDAQKWPQPIDFMISNQVMNSSNVSRCDHIIFVYRDPLERIVSLFKNKFVMRDGHEHLFRTYAQVAGEEPGCTSFRRFVQNYLRPNLRQLDPHVLPQAWHLKRFNYTDAIPMGALHERMAKIIGPILANKYFARPINATSQKSSLYVPDAADIAANKLAADYDRDCIMPNNNSFLDEMLSMRLRSLYADDMRMIAAIER